MRDLLFRAKRTDNGEWVEGSYVHLYLNRHYILLGNSISLSIITRVV